MSSDFMKDGDVFAKTKCAIVGLDLFLVMTKPVHKQERKQLKHGIKELKFTF